MKTPDLCRALFTSALCGLALAGCELAPTDPAETDDHSDAPTSVDLAGEVVCDGCGPIVVALFDNADQSGAPLDDTMLSEEGPFSFTIEPGLGEVWLVAFDDRNGNGAPDEGEPLEVDGPHLVADADIDDIVIELEGPITGDTVTLSGELSCFEGCHAPLGILLLAEGDEDPVFETVVTKLGAYAIDVPSNLGEVQVFAYEDLNRNRRYDVGEYAGAHGEELSVEEADLSDVDVYVGRPPEEIELPGVVDRWGNNVAPGELFVYLDDGASAESIAAAVGAELKAELHSVGAAVITWDGETLDDLVAMEADLLAEDGVLRTERSSYVTIHAARLADDNDALPASDTWAYDLLRTRDAKDQYDDCSYLFTEPIQFNRYVDVAVVDTDMQGVRNGTEFAGITTSFRDHHTTRPTDPETVDGHGSMVTSVIAANNDGVGMNGMLSGFTGTTPKGKAYTVGFGLHLHNVGYGDGMSSGTVAAAIESAARGRASVINISLGSYAKSIGHLRGIRQDHRRLTKLFAAYPDKVFVLAAGNNNRSLDTGFHKASMRAPNLIVAGAIQRDLRRWDGGDKGSNWGSFVTVAAPGNDVYVWRQRVRHTPAGATLADSTYGRANGTSFAAPIVTSHVAMMQAIDPNLKPSSIVAGLRRASDAGPANLGGDRVHFRRTVQARLEAEINTGTSWLMDLETSTPTVTGDAECSRPMSRGTGHQCIPILGENTWSSMPQAKDWQDQAYTLGGSLAGSSPSDKVDFTIEGQGITFGIGPLKTTYKGTVKTDPGDPDPVPGDLFVEGTFEGNTTGSGPSCNYKGTWKGWLRRSDGP